MKNYYRGPLKRAVATNPVKRENSINYDYNMEINTIKKNILFHRNFFNALIKDDDGVPVYLETELDDLFQFSFQNGSTSCSYEFVDEMDLVKLKEEPKEAKTFVKTIKQRFKR